MTSANRIHCFCYGHRVYGHENKCAHLHGHNGRVTFSVVSEELDKVGRVIDFSEINRRLCNWIEDTWDHKFIVYNKDPWAQQLIKIDPYGVWFAPFNPTAENLANYLVEQVGPEQLRGTNTKLAAVKFEETDKCFAVYTKEFK